MLLARRTVACPATVVHRGVATRRLWLTTSSPTANTHFNTMKRTVSSPPLSGLSSSLSYSSRPLSSSPVAANRVSQLSSHLGPRIAAASPPSSRSAFTSASLNTSPWMTGGGELGDEPKVYSTSDGTLRTIFLNRPKAINALDLSMVEGIDAELEASLNVQNCATILLRGLGRGLCSGGDVLSVVNAANSQDAGERAHALRFFQREFELDHKIAKLGERMSIEQAAVGSKSDGDAGAHRTSDAPKTFVSFMDGICMGGGVGLSLHAPFRVATERTRFAMPETGIGYFPDVGVTRCLARLDGKLGPYLGLTGREVSGEEAYLAGLATHFVPSSMLVPLEQRLATLGVGANANHVARVINEFSVDPFAATFNERGPAVRERTPFLGDRRIALDYVFGQRSVEAIFATLSELGEGSEADIARTQAATELRTLGLSNISSQVREWAHETMKTLRTKSPRSLKVSLFAVPEARRFDVDEAFRFDMRVATAFCDLAAGRDFYTGVHHVLTRDPATGKRRTGVAPWEPSSLEAVDDSKLAKLFFGSPRVARDADLLHLDVPSLAIPPPPRDKNARIARDVALRGIGPLAWEPYHNAFAALPSDAECAALVDGSHPAAGAHVLERDELVDALRRYRSGTTNNAAYALELKVDDWLDRVARKQHATQHA